MIIDDLVRGVPAIRHAVLLSPDGLVLDHSADLAPTDAEYLASMAAMLSSLAQRAGALLDGGRTQHLLVRCDNTTLLLVRPAPPTAWR